MTQAFNRRRFIYTSGSLLLLLPLAQHCKSGSDKEKGAEKPKERIAARHRSRLRKPPVTMAMVSNRGWYQHSKNRKIHYFDNRGYTPSLEFMKDKAQFDTFIAHLQPWDPKQITMDDWKRNIVKKKKDWMTEQAALAFIAAGSYQNAALVIRERIEKRPANLRLWDLLAITSIKDDQVNTSMQEMVKKYSDSIDKKLYTHLAKFSGADWQTKLKARELTWNNQKI